MCNTILFNPPTPTFYRGGHRKVYMPLATYINLQKLGNNDCPNYVCSRATCPGAT